MRILSKLLVPKTIDLLSWVPIQLLLIVEPYAAVEAVVPILPPTYQGLPGVILSIKFAHNVPVQ